MAMEQFIEHKIAKHVTVISHSTFTAKNGDQIPSLRLWFNSEKDRSDFYEALRDARKGKK